MVLVRVTHMTAMITCPRDVMSLACTPGGGNEVSRPATLQKWAVSAANGTSERLLLPSLILRALMLPMASCAEAKAYLLVTYPSQLCIFGGWACLKFRKWGLWLTQNARRAGRPMDLRESES